jgi:hypothetical protein
MRETITPQTEPATARAVPEAAVSPTEAGEETGATARLDRMTGPTGSSEGIDEVLGLLDEWMADESGFEEETWEELQSALDEDRLSARRLFPE